MRGFKAKRTDAPRTAIFAGPGRLLRVRGTGAPSSIGVWRLIAPAILLGLSFLVFGVASAAAAGPPTVTIEAPSLINAGAARYALSGKVNPKGAATEWEFTCSPSCGSPAGGTLPVDEASHVVAAQVEGLKVGTTYTITLKATSSEGSNSATTSLTTPTPTGLPWWHLESSTRPTYIDPGSRKPAVPGVDEVQEIIMPLVGGQGAFELGISGAHLEENCGAGESLGCFVYPEEFANEVGFTPMTPAAIRQALEGPYGSGNVAVTEHLDVATETVSFLVTTPPSVTPLKVHEFSSLGAPTARIVTPGTPGTPEFADGNIVLTAENLGTAPIDGSVTPVILKDTLPAGLKPIGVVATRPGPEANFQKREELPCAPAALTCELKGVLQPYDAIEMKIAVNVTGPVTAPNEFQTSGGGAAATSVSEGVVVSTAPVPFAVHDYSMSLEEEGGGPSTRAGAHPLQFTTQIGLNQGRDINPLVNEFARPEVLPVGLAKNVDFNLPPGLIGNPSKLPRCSTAQFFSTDSSGSENFCPASSAVGVINVTVHEPANVGTVQIPEPIFNLEPNYGEPARFGFFVIIANSPVFIDTAVRSGNGADYGITAESNNITQTAAFLSATATFWGVPGAHAHDSQRGYGCFLASRDAPTHAPCLPNEELHPPVLFSNPTRCSSPLSTTVTYNAWEDRAFRNFAGTFSPGGLLGGCNQVPFGPEIHSEPTSNAATSPTGLRFDIDVDDPGLENPGGLVQSQIKRAVVTLPQGFTTNPSVAEGLKACSQAEYEAATATEGTGCLEESKVGEVEIQSPIIPTNAEGITPKVKGGLYVARQGQNPNHNLLTIYMIARSPELGVLVRQALKVTPNPVTGQLETEVDNIPQLPFSKFHLEFRTGQRAPLVTPSTCGTYTVGADLYPYSEPAAPLHRESSFAINTGPEGQGCPSGTPPFHPGLEAGTLNNAAGTYSPFVTHITRKDSEQEITRFSIKLPTGLIAKLKGVSECSDAAVAAAKARETEGGASEEEAHPSCPANSEVGHTLVGTGVGSVLAYAGGKLYLAGPYHGSPISLVSVNYAKVGPFDLGTVVVRFALDVNHETAEVSVDGATSDPIPHIVDGIPIHLRDIRAYVSRPNFTLNPTSCAKKSTAATILGSGASFTSSADDVPVTVSSPFQAADCASLGFAPKLALNLVGKKTHRGALPAFKAVLTYPKGGNYANIAAAQVTLPGSEFLEQGHLKNVCTRKVFETGKNPGENCPANSIYGKARATTPLLDAPLEGPVYLRTGYGTKLPELAAALNGPQISITLAGKIDSVHQKGTEGSRIRNTFSVVPDAPVEKFTLELKGGKKGLLVNSTDVCKGTHKALAAFTGQNGKLDEYEPALKAQCGKGGKKKSKGKKGGKGKQSGTSNGGGNK
jgi:hypothetical protein